AYASLAIGVLELFKEMGFSSALIYRREDVEEAANTTFVAVLISSVLLYGLAWVASPWIAQFFRNEGLVQVLRVLSLTLVISAISQVPLTLMAKGMGFKNKVIPEMIAGFVGSAVSVVLALLGYGVWSIVYGRLLISLMTAMLVWFFCPWRPSLRFSGRVAKELWNYGKHILSSQIMVFFITNIDDAFVGRFLGDAALGTYSLAYELSNLPATHLSRIVGQVMFPAFSKVQSDPRRLRNVFFRSMKYVSLAAFPIAIITMVFAKDFIIVAYGKKWFQAVVPLQLLTIYGLARAIAVNMGNVFKAGGKPRWLFFIASWRLAMMVLFLYPAIKFWGIVGVAGLSAVVAIVDFFLSMFLTNRVIHARWRDYARILLPMLVAAVGTALLGHQFYLLVEKTIHPFISLPLMGGVALVLYFALMYAYDADIRQVTADILTGVRREFRRMRVTHGQPQA
ncbi:MAG: lipopolysaccharide biosynthesis protein, partial [Anaerolineae bacterium]|nr:lipopolysaccharide biosynthesis protein [Anaerolineae bacterium]